MKVITDEKTINELLSRGVEEIIEKEHLIKILKTGKQIRVKLGIDPTAPDLHLGHGVPLRKLRQFQNLGHKAVLIIGDATAMVGDPSGRSETRKIISASEIKKNMKNYLKHAGKILDIKKTEVRYNSDWLDKNMTTILELSKAGTIQQVLHRADFKKRIENNQDITILEVLYPLLQGYDSVAIKADLEIGGADQKFNLLMGRRVQRFYQMPEQDILTLPLLEGIDGIKKMSKSFGNYISLDEKPNDMFGKLMSIPDNLITKYMRLCTDISFSEIEQIENNIKKQLINPRDAKVKLALNIVRTYHGEKKAKEAEENFVKTFQKKGIPDSMEEVVCEIGELLCDALVKNKILASKGEWRRLVLGNAVHDLIKNQNITDQNIKILNNLTLKIGKKRFIKLLIK
ncbi:MAG: tyrosine--tRNA ligase [Patescibacteria group bacterium]